MPQGAVQQMAGKRSSVETEEGGKGKNML